MTRLTEDLLTYLEHRAAEPDDQFLGVDVLVIRKDVLAALVAEAKRMTIAREVLGKIAADFLPSSPQALAFVQRGAAKDALERMGNG